MFALAFIVLLSCGVDAFRTVSSRPLSSSLKMAWNAKETNEHFLIAPSILSADFARLGEEVDNVLAAGADVVHFDVMGTFYLYCYLFVHKSQLIILYMFIDNHYVPNLTIGPMVCKALRDHGVTKDIDVHLMVQPVDAMIQDFAKAGASYITFHPEASNHVDRLYIIIKSLYLYLCILLTLVNYMLLYVCICRSLGLIRSLGLKSGLVLTPSTSLDYCKYVSHSFLSNCPSYQHLPLPLHHI